MQAFASRPAKALLFGLLAALAAASGGCPNRAECGDGVIEGDEICDDANAAAGDGCSDACTVEAGYSCTGQPSVCTATTGDVCGDGDVAASEGCDDGNTTAGDGCDDDCDVEAGFTCTGEPSVCTATTGDVCGDGAIGAAEACDDGNTTAGDGCDDSCAVEAGFMCAGEPSVCTPVVVDVCGDGLVGGTEECDDGNVATGDGCDDTCFEEFGFTCTGEPSVCVADVCGDGLVGGSEDCDDGNTAAGDGCDDACFTEVGWFCSGEPSVCCQDECPVPGDSICSGSVIVDCTIGTDLCYDLVPGVDCAASGEACVEMGAMASCVAVPSFCGDGVVDAGEQCDDGGAVSGDGCDAACFFEATCGNATIEPGESCDDGNTTDMDGCDSGCQLESGTTCGDAIDLDDPSEVTVIGNVTTYDGDTTGSTVTDFGPGSCYFGAGGIETNVHRYTMNGAGTLTVETIDIGSSLVDSVIWAYADCQGPSGELECDDDGGVGAYSLFTTAVADVLPAGTTVFIVVTGYNAGDAGPYQLVVTENPYTIIATDGTCAAPTVAVPFVTYTGTTEATDPDTETGTCSLDPNPEGVFELTITTTSDILVTADGVPAGMDIILYMRDTPCSGGTELACIDSAGADNAETIAMSVVAPGTYYFVMDGWATGDVGDYTIVFNVVAIIPVGDPCTPGSPAERCDFGICTGPAGAETCQLPTTLLLEDFTTDLGTLTVTDANADGETWVWCDPTGGCFFGNTTGSASGGGFTVVSDPGLTEDLDGELLTSGPIDATGLSSVTLEFDHNFDDYPFSDEEGRVQVSLDGLAWTDLVTYTDADAVGHVVLDLSAYAGGTFYVRFYYDDSISGMPGDFAEEWRVDDVFIWGI